MIFLFLFPLYIFAAGWMLYRFFYWLKNCHHVFDWKRIKLPLSVLYVVVALSPLTAFVLPKSGFAVVIRRISTTWLGVMLYTLMFIALFCLLRLIVRKTKLKDTRLFSRVGIISVGSLVAVCAVSVCLYGLINARNIRTAKYSVSVNKSCEDLQNIRVVLISDLHMGYSIGERQIRKMADKVKAQHPDLILIAGDIFDNSFDSLDAPDKIRESFRDMVSSSKYGAYAVMGNHDVDEKILIGFTFDWSGRQKQDKRMVDFLEESGIKLLQDETELVDNKFYIAGRRDGEKPCTENGERNSVEELVKGLDKSKPIFLMDHEPAELQRAADAGVDVDFSGHTHDGQLFPATLAVNLSWENPCGVLKKGDMTSVVTSGVGVYGPYMRVGSQAEICVVDVNFE